MDVLRITKLARDMIVELTEQSFDAIAACEATSEGWRVEVDVIESRARMGDDDLITIYQLEIDLEGVLRGYRRLGRRRRFEDAPSAA